MVRTAFCRIKANIHLQGSGRERRKNSLANSVISWIHLWVASSQGPVATASCSVALWVASVSCHTDLEAKRLNWRRVWLWRLVVEIGVLQEVLSYAWNSPLKGPQASSKPSRHIKWIFTCSETECHVAHTGLKPLLICFYLPSSNPRHVSPYLAMTLQKWIL